MKDTRKYSLDDALQYIKGVGPKRTLLLEKLGLKNIEDCLFFLPFRYEDRTLVKKIADLIPGERVTLTGEVVVSETQHIGRRKKIMEIQIEDGTGTISAKWFRFRELYMTEKYPVGSKVILSGKPEISRYQGGGLEVIHPDMEVISAKENEPPEIGKFIPVYHSTDGLHMKTLRAILNRVVETHAPLVAEILPDEVIRRHKFPSRSQALHQVHQPTNDLPIKDLDRFRTPAQTRLIFEEFFLIQVGLAFKKRRIPKTVGAGRAFKTRGPLIGKFMKLLKFELTQAQKRILREIMDDLEQDKPMNRLIQGDVGSGKTVAALICLLTAVENNTQCALMVPTEILAEQHFLNIQPFCQQLGVSIELVTSALPAKEKKLIHQRIQEGDIQIVVGTHALIQKSIEFKNLGLAVIDEQHRFGVLQREAIGKKGGHPHILVMTATPIPRSLALTLYGEMDVSLLDEFPPGRQPIATKIFFEPKRDRAYAVLREETDKGRQAFVVCPLIEESETLDLKTAIEVQEYLQNQLFPDLTISLIHGKMKKEERQKIMADFLAQKIDVLVATTVIEVGIDVPNATVMIIEHAERFGLSQLHQLRGRVGRGLHASQCLLIAYPSISGDGKARLDAIEKSNDGFVIAEQDLKIRGPGDFMGTRQSGMPILRVANLIRDIKILESARKEAFQLLDRDPELKLPEHQHLKQALKSYLGDKLDLMNII
ncbi:ATP-dependent DNA helicase RecG [hydrothermal vent metagenome]|uniref:ATP-dependent DNA helicase RecG n=1 Tax=hydrothermal vent metagenome TaxID=652676 RepID=A0A3B1CH04_9ZZZZ